MQDKKGYLFGGFTLIELLVVVAIISLLSSLVLSSLQGARQKAQVARMAEDFRQIENAFNLYMVSEGKQVWPDGSYFGEGDYPLLPDLVENTEFSEYMSTAPSRPVSLTDGADQWDTYTYNGPDNGMPKIALSWVPQEIVDDYIQMIDGEVSYNSGRVRYESGRNQINYILSETANF